MSVIGNPGIVTDGLLFCYDTSNIKSYVGQPTTNTIPSPTTNAYPTYGNGWGTYNTNQYGSGAFFSIGTVSGVSNNIVTMSANHSLRSYDVMRPQTTGGGVTANTDYLIKKISDTTFSLHAYNSSQDGSQGYISSSTNTHKVYDDFANDVRVSINSTNFPTMWWGAPHLPNSGLVKEIIPNGYDVDPQNKTNCIRLHYIRTDGVIDGMSYNVDATVTVGSPNTHSFWTRAVTPDAVGKNVGMSIYNYGANPYQYFGLNFTLGPLMVWQRQTYTFTPVNTNIITYWFGGGPPPYKWDLANIQVEAKGNVTNFVAGSRSNTQGLLDLTGNTTVNLANAGFSSSAITFDGANNYIDIGTSTALNNLSNVLTIEAVIKTSVPNTRQTIYGTNYTNLMFGTSANTPGGLEVYTPGVYVAYTNGSLISANTWTHVVYTRSGTGAGTHAFYVNGVSQTLASDTASNFTAVSGSKYVGLRSGVMFNGEIPVVRVYDRALSAAEIRKNYNSLKSRYGL
jgi:hypothetical protein